ncbi:adenylate/guanylate cyclase domain-containing protein [Actinomadura barringtoniae]|uniref:Adenylate/guanylate cyclase domain-containing protein n=1 Tax=Actinomadura barringtoniae TaxID=1427535 RepID=A0A939T2T6_9ACTN|nr:adenylate/guanylate cyclase domain-containing protein [Actinomadura barringtoniae]MBO2450171.1 adenylate/guanylate cyclase domain-containing protein [Actinomadura barringtoniae]
MEIERADPPAPARDPAAGARDRAAGPDPVPARSRRSPFGLLWRLIDGRPDDTRPQIMRRAHVLVTVATGLANLVGALVVLLFSVVVPTPDGSVSDRIRLINFVVFAAYVVAAVPVGLILGERFFRRARRLVEGNLRPDNRERVLLLYGPLRLMAVHLTLWGIGTVGWVIINLPFSWLLAVKLGVTSLLGGITTCTVVYLLTERLLRRAVTTALSAGIPGRTGLPGVVARSVLAWALGTAVPLLGLIVLAVGSFGLAKVTLHDFAVVVLALGGTSLLVGLGVTYGAARAIADPVESVRLGLARVERGDLDVEVPVYDASEVGLLQAGFNHMAAGLREHARLQDLFGRQVGEDVAKVALEHGIDLGGELREVAVIFVDLVGSTRLAADRPPTEVVKLLNDFFAVVVEVIGAHGGWINKFEGDAALAIFGAPLALEGAQSRALAAARELAERLRREVPTLRAAVGVSAGEAVAGHIGAEERFEYTVIGDPVNEAARLTDLAKTTADGVLAAGSVVESAGADEAAHWWLGEEVTLRGRTQETRLASPRQEP